MPDQDQEQVEQQDDTVSVAQLAAEGPTLDTPTVAEILRRGYEQAEQERQPKDIVIPGYGEPESELHVLLRPLEDYNEVRDEIRRAFSKKGLKPAARELALGIETLKRASIGSYALVNGERHEIGQSLGLGLYNHLWAEAQNGKVVKPGNDAQAIVLLFHRNTTMLMTIYGEFDQWMRRGGRDSEEELLGE